MLRFNGLRIIEDSTLVESYEDWSGVRSLGRARRRRRRGHKQNVVTRYKPKMTAYQVNDTLVMHPAMANELRKVTRHV